MSMEKKVITVKGEELPISQCKKFKTLYYKIGDTGVLNSGDCYLINNKYYRHETGLIVYNYSISQYVILDNSLIFGVVNVIKEDFIYGYFEKNSTYSKIKNHDVFYLFDPEVCKNNKYYRERLSDGDFYHIKLLPAQMFNHMSFISWEYKKSLNYDSKSIIRTNLKNYNENYNPEISNSIKKYAPLLEDLSFGLEFETTKGFIPNRILNQYGLIPLRDGSISGIEYVTVPMQGEKGLQCTADILKVLEERTEYDDATCSLHLHLGNIPRTKEFILAFFKVGMKIQDEMFQMFPLYKKYNYDIKNKNYSEPLPTFDILSQLNPVIDSDNIDDNFNVIYKYLSMGQDFKKVDCDLDNVHAHPSDPNSNQKWKITTRYHLFNLIPLIFGNKQTIEFRIHTPTYDVSKVILFITINSLLVNFTIKNQKLILGTPNYLKNFDFRNILDTQLQQYQTTVNYNGVQQTIMDYFLIRKKYCRLQTLTGNVLGDESKIPIHYKIDYTNN